MADLIANVKEQADDLWWLFVLQGVLTVLFGILALFLPGLTLVTLVYLFAIYVVIWGVLEVVRGFVQIGKVGSWWFSILFGIAAVGVGVYLIRNPDTLANVFLITVGGLILFRGVFDLFMAAFVLKSNDNRFLWVLSGILGIIAAIVLWRHPVTASLAFVWVMGLYSVIVGAVTIAFGFRVHSSGGELEEESPKRVATRKK